MDSGCWFLISRHKFQIQIVTNRVMMCFTLRFVIFFLLIVGSILLLLVIQEGFLCVSSSCRVSGQRMWLMAPVWLSTTSTGWWPLAAPGTCLCKRLPFSPSPYIVYRAVLESDLGCVCWICVCVCVWYREVVVSVVCVCVQCENLSVCVCWG